MKNLLITLAILMNAVAVCYGQGWWQLYPPHIYPQVLNYNNCVEQLPSGNYIFAGNGIDIADFNGNYLGKLANPDCIPGWKLGFVRNADSTITYTGTLPGNQGAVIGKIDRNGQCIWQKFYYPGAYIQGHYLSTTSDGGYIITGVTSNNPTEGYILRLDAQGDSLWLKPTWSRNAHESHHTTDGGYLVKVTSTGTSSMYKANQNGDSLWTRPVATARTVAFGDNDHFYTAYSNTGTTIQVHEYDGEAALQRNITFTVNTPSSGLSVDVFKRLDDGGYILITNVQASSFPNWSTLLLRLDSQMNEVWRKSFNHANQTFKINGASQTYDGGFITVGHLEQIGPLVTTPFLLKLDGSGNMSSAMIDGVVYADMDEDCQQGASETNTLPNRVIEITDVNNPLKSLLAYSDNNGYYTMNIDTGLYEVSIYTNNSYWRQSACFPSNNTVQLSSLTDTTHFNIPVAADIYCPDLHVHISAPFIRRCFGSTYTVSYSNNGTQPTDTAYIEVELDPYLTFNSASIPWSTANGKYVFPIGFLGIGQSGWFTIDVTVGCADVVMGQTHCTEARIIPDSLCFPINPDWDGSSIEVDGLCDNDDSVKLWMENIGTGNAAAVPYIIIEDNVMLANGNRPLLVGERFEWVFPANGSTRTLMATQTAFHPPYSHPLFSIEGCGNNGSGTFTVGIKPQFPTDDEAPYLDIDCQGNIGAFDPNDKTPAPLGIGMEGYISKGQRLEYKIRFQNTGTDTAFRVVVRDTITEMLDLTSIQIGAVSHAYTFAIRPGRVMEWTFNNILLPDSNVNEPASHGFIQFTINQADSLTEGTEIENSAAIYFDFNEAVITNTSLNTIAENLYSKLEVSVEEVLTSNMSIKVYPNPSIGQVTFEIKGASYPELRLQVFDMLGSQQREVLFTNTNHLTIDDLNLQPGMYLFSITTKATVVGKGKLMIE